MVLPEPTFSFKIPSIYDSALIECRIYHPPRFRPPVEIGEYGPESPINSGSGSRGGATAATTDREGIISDHQARISPFGRDTTRCLRRGAVIAHPYAPLGGSYDDPAVNIIASEAVRAGFVVGTFNFRGAGGSEGSTSWTAKPELGDYVSMAGFLAHYLSNLQTNECVYPDHEPISIREDSGGFRGSGPSNSNSTGIFTIDASKDITLLLSGYSYGSMITSRLPDTDRIYARFTDVQRGSSEAEIKRRAENLAHEWSRDASPRTLHSKTVGWEESQSRPGSQRTSHEVRKSIEAIRKGVDHIKKKKEAKHHHGQDPTTAQAVPLGDTRSQTPSHFPAPEPSFRTLYLLISPLLPPVSLLATLFSRQMTWGSQEDSDRRLSRHDSLAIYGDQDMFTSGKKLRRWAEHVNAFPQSKFQFLEIPGAGHFWHDLRVAKELRMATRSWFEACLDHNV